MMELYKIPKYQTISQVSLNYNKFIFQNHLYTK
jgi:hypothetical protein